MLSVKELMEDETITGIVNQIVTNHEFVDECTKQIKENILKDNKIDQSDLPYLVNIVVLVLNSKPKIKVSNDAMKQVMKLLIVRLLDEIKYIDLKSEIPILPEQEKLIDLSLNLLGTTLIVTKKYCKCINV
jgi:hypothetical protein